MEDRADAWLRQTSHRRDGAREQLMQWKDSVSQSAKRINGLQSARAG